MRQRHRRNTAMHGFPSFVAVHYATSITGLQISPDAFGEELSGDACHDMPL
jgi:hypothetical protein